MSFHLKRISTSVTDLAGNRGLSMHTTESQIPFCKVLPVLENFMKFSSTGRTLSKKAPKEFCTKFFIFAEIISIYPSQTNLQQLLLLQYSQDT